MDAQQSLEVVALTALNRKRGRRLELVGLNKSPIRVMRSNPPRAKRKIARQLAANAKKHLKQHVMASQKPTTPNPSDKKRNNFSKSTFARQSSINLTPENCENSSPTPNTTTTAASKNAIPKTPKSSQPTSNSGQSPVQKMLRQLQSDLSPKYISPSTPSSSVRCSRYGRAQRTKESSDFLDTDFALAVRKSITDKSSPTTNNSNNNPSNKTQSSLTSTSIVVAAINKSPESLSGLYNVNLKRSPVQKEVISPIQALIIKNKVIRDEIEKTGNNSEWNPPVLGTEYDRRNMLKVNHQLQSNNQSTETGATKTKTTTSTTSPINTRHITDRSCRIPPQKSTQKFGIDLQLSDGGNKPFSIHLRRINESEHLGTKKSSVPNAAKLAHIRRINIPLPPLFSEEPNNVAPATNVVEQHVSPTKAARKFVSPVNSPLKSSEVNASASLNSPSPTNSAIKSGLELNSLKKKSSLMELSATDLREEISKSRDVDSKQFTENGDFTSPQENEECDHPTTTTLPGLKEPTTQQPSVTSASTEEKFVTPSKSEQNSLVKSPPKSPEVKDLDATNKLISEKVPSGTSLKGETSREEPLKSETFIQFPTDVGDNKSNLPVDPDEEPTFSPMKALRKYPAKSPTKAPKLLEMSPTKSPIKTSNGLESLITGSPENASDFNGHLLLPVDTRSGTSMEISPTKNAQTSLVKSSLELNISPVKAVLKSPTKDDQRSIDKITTKAAVKKNISQSPIVDCKRSPLPSIVDSKSNAIISKTPSKVVFNPNSLDVSDTKEDSNNQTTLTMSTSDANDSPKLFKRGSKRKLLDTSENNNSTAVFSSNLEFRKHVQSNDVPRNISKSPQTIQSPPAATSDRQGTPHKIDILNISTPTRTRSNHHLQQCDVFKIPSPRSIFRSKRTLTPGHSDLKNSPQHLTPPKHLNNLESPNHTDTTIPNQTNSTTPKHSTNPKSPKHSNPMTPKHSNSITPKHSNLNTIKRYLHVTTPTHSNRNSPQQSPTSSTHKSPINHFDTTATTTENAVEFLLNQYPISSPKANRRRLLSLTPLKKKTTETTENSDLPHTTNQKENTVDSKQQHSQDEPKNVPEVSTISPSEILSAPDNTSKPSKPLPANGTSARSFKNAPTTNPRPAKEPSPGTDKRNGSFDGDACPSVSSEDSAKGSSIADEPDPSSTNANKPVDNYVIGDLAWARLGRHPFWPSVVCNSPEGMHISYTTGKKNSAKRIHIRFLADNGRRSWVPTHSMMPFKSIEDFETKKRELPSNLKAKDRRVRGFTVSESKVILWSQAIIEAQMLAVFPNDRRPTILENKLNEEIKPKLHLPITTKKRLASVASVESFDSLLTENMQRNKTSTPCITSPQQTLVDCDDQHEMRLLSRSPTPDSPEYEELSINLPVSDDNETDNKIQSYLQSISNDGTASPIPDDHHQNAEEDDSHEHAPSSLDVADKMLRMANDSDFLDYFQSTKQYFMDEYDTRTEMHLKHLALKMYMLQKMKDSTKATSVKNRSKPLQDEDEGESLDNTVVEPVAKRKKVEAQQSKTETQNNQSNKVRKSSRMSMADYKSKRIGDEDTSEMEKKKTHEAVENSEALAAEKAAQRAARAAEKEKRELEEMSKYFMKEYPKHVLFKGLKKELVCRVCHETGELVKCTVSTCNEYMHHFCGTEPEEALSKLAIVKKRQKSKSSKKEDDTPGFPVTGDMDLVSAPTPMETDECEPTERDQETALKSNNNKLPYCPDCIKNEKPVCYVCKVSNGAELRCTEKQCGRQFHVDCLKYWPQNKIISDYQLLCPCHVCHTCISDDPRGKHHKIPSNKLIKCVKCPATYHIDSCCIPAGCQLLTATQLICPRHRVEVRKPVNADWCFICSRGGELVCCETCPTAFHAECLRVPVPEDTCYICEECETGRYPLYGEIVWAKIAFCKWWPAVVVPPNEIPEPVLAVKRQPFNFAVRFFGARNYSWISRGFVFLYQEDDSEYSFVADSKSDKIYSKALVEAKAYAAKLKEINEKHVNPDKDRAVLPLVYTKIKTNKAIPPVRLNVAMDEDEERVCQCTPNDDDPCGPQSACLNRALSIECDSATCPAGPSCQNQRFEKRQYPNLIERRTEGKGWGLVTLDPIPMGAFIIEYVGELINNKEFERRIQVMQQVKDEHYYFMTVNFDLMIDAGPRGNSARFMNHSCEPNCEPQYWLVKGNTRVGLFALTDIPANTELTFNYNLECIGEMKKICFCGAKKCAGFIGAKYVEPLPIEPKHPVKQKASRPGRKSLKKQQQQQQQQPTDVKKKPKQSKMLNYFKTKEE